MSLIVSWWAVLGGHDGGDNRPGQLCAGGEHASKVFEKAAGGPRQWLEPGGMAP
jgi:hypothetical protein